MANNANLELAQRSLRAFAAAVHPRFKAPPHIRYIISKLEAVERGEIDRLMIFCPPRHGKSLLISGIFPAWCLGRNPEQSVIASSYGAELATDFGRKVRSILADLPFRAIFPNVHLLDDTASQSRLGLQQGGAYFAVGAGGALTGRGGNKIIIDDPIKGREDADSETQRRSLQSWFESVLYPRLEPGGSIVLIETRWSEDDIGGWLLREHAADGWHVVILPALAEANDPLGREEGAPLWPERYPLETLERIREAIGSSAWLSLYQQRPSAAQGNVFKREWWQLYDFDPDDQPEYLRVTLSLDTAQSIKQSADFSVAQVWAETENGYFLLHQVRKRCAFPELLATVRELAADWHPHAVLVEEASSGWSLIQALRTETRLPVIPTRTEGKSKGSRAAAASAVVEAGKVYLPRAASWLPDFLDELSSFPNGQHDDQVDSLSQFLNWARIWPIEFEQENYIDDLIGIFGR